MPVAEETRPYGRWRGRNIAGRIKYEHERADAVGASLSAQRQLGRGIAEKSVPAMQASGGSAAAAFLLRSVAEMHQFFSRLIM